MSKPLKNLGLFSVNVSIFRFINKIKYDNWQTSNVDKVVKSVPTLLQASFEILLPSPHKFKFLEQ